MAYAVDKTVGYAGSGADYITDGVNDEVQINQALMDCGAGYTVTLMGSSTYWIDATITIPSQRTLTGQPGAKIKLVANAGWAADVPMLKNSATTDHDIVICGFEIDGNKASNPETEGQNYYNCIQFNGGQNLSVHHMWLHDNKNDACKARGGADSVFFYNNTVLSGHDGFYGYTATHLYIFNNYFDLRTNCGVRVDSGDYAYIHDNTINGATGGGAGIQFQNNASGPTMGHLEVYNNTVYATRHPGIWAFTAKDQPTTSNIYVHNNVFYDCGQKTGTNADIVGGIMTQGWSMSIENNVFDGCYGAALTVKKSSYAVPAGTGYSITVRSNIFSNTRAGLLPEGGAGWAINDSLASTHTVIALDNCFYNNEGGNFNGTGIAHTDELLADPCYADRTGHDYHLKSTVGRWTGSEWTTDTEHSPCIDTGCASSSYDLEPEPNGGRINMGRWGNTEYASKSRLSVPSLRKKDRWFKELVSKKHLEAAVEEWRKSHSSSPD